MFAFKLFPTSLICFAINVNGYAQEVPFAVLEESGSIYDMPLRVGYQSECVQTKNTTEKGKLFSNKSITKSIERVMRRQGDNYYETEVWFGLNFVRLSIKIGREGYIEENASPVIESNFAKDLTDSPTYHAIDRVIRNAFINGLAGKKIAKDKLVQQSICEMLDARTVGDNSSHTEVAGVAQVSNREAVILKQKYTASCYLGDSYTFNGVGWMARDKISGLTLKSFGELKTSIRNEPSSEEVINTDCIISYKS